MSDSENPPQTVIGNALRALAKSIEEKEFELGKVNVVLRGFREGRGFCNAVCTVGQSSVMLKHPIEPLVASLSSRQLELEDELMVLRKKAEKATEAVKLTH